MRDRTCPECGETKSWRQFWGQNRQPMKICTPCRRKAKGRARYYRRKQAAEQDAARRAVSAALAAQERMLKASPLYGAVQELDRHISQAMRTIEQNEQKIVDGTETRRNRSSLAYQRRKLAYYQDVRKIMLEDAARGFERPLEHYLTNTHMLAKHGFPVAVVDKPLDVRDSEE